MITLLSRWFIKNHDQVKEKTVRRAYGTLCSIVGIALNLLLFAGKYFAGIISRSVAITADSFNNLSDAGSSLIMLFGFRISGKKADADHPYGHGRAEYVTGLVVSFLILLMGIELFSDSFQKILHPEAIEFSYLSIAILGVSVLIKVYMAFYNRQIGKKIDSSAMAAVSTDSLSDTISTLVVLASTLVAHFTGWKIDGYCGLLVACFILYAGFSSAKETLGDLLGRSPDPELVEEIKKTVLAYPEVVGIHDMLIHDYGPGRLMVSLHAEVPGDSDIYLLHDAVDRAEMELMEKFGCESTIHMDPVDCNDEEVTKAKVRLINCIRSFDDSFSIHDFRMVTGPTHTNFIFDVAVPVDDKRKDEQIRLELESLVSHTFEKTFAVFKIDRIRF